MENTSTQDALRQYNQADVHGQVNSASPHRLIKMLLDNALAKIASAKGCMIRNNIPQKCENISQTMNIVEGLRLSLDKQQGGDIAENLEQLYDYIEQRLLQANLKNDPALLDEITSLLGEIKTGWDAIADTAVDLQQADSPGAR